MKIHLLALSVAVTAMALTAFPARSQPTNCGERAALVERLGSRYGESRQSVGVAANRSVVEVYANPATGSWSITVPLPNGTMCLVASGMSYEALAAVAPSAMGTRL